MSNMETIISKLQRYDSFRWIDTKTGWNKLEKGGETVDNIIEAIRKHKWETLETSSNDMSQNDREKSLVTLVRNSQKSDKPPWFYRGEEALERLIYAFNSNYGYTYQFGCNDKELIDLVCPKIKPNILIELKPWESDNSPMYGVVEILKNYHLYKNFVSNTPPITLILLAPLEYYEKYKDNRDVFLTLVSRINADVLKDGVQLKVQYIDVKENDFLNCVKKLADSIQKWDPAEKGNTQYDKYVRIDLSSDESKVYFDGPDGIKDKLMSCKFIDW